MIKFFPKDNRGFSWFEKQQVYCKGFLYTKQDKLLQDQELCDYFNTDTAEEFSKRLVDANGTFSVVLIKETMVLAATDRLRTFPLFYKTSEDGIIISDIPDTLCTDAECKPFDDAGISTFKACGFVSGDNTLLQNIKQVQACEYIYYTKESGLKRRFYYSFIAQANEQKTESPADRLNETIWHVFSRFREIIKNKQVVIPLSGGFDSRLIAVMLKMMNHQDVICFTYGPKNKPEVQISQKVADSLGFRWIHTPLEESQTKNFRNSSTFQAYFQYAARYTSMFFMQEYFPVKYLSENKLIRDDAIFMPGHSGDFIAGSHLNPKIVNENSKDKITKHIYSHYFDLIPETSKHRKYSKQKITKQLKDLTEYKGTNVLPYSLFEDWNMKERQAKFIVNSSRVYNFFGYRFYHPLWDMELIEFFRKLPVEHRINKNLYNFAIRNSFFKKFEVDYQPYKKSPPLFKNLSKLKQVIKKTLPAQHRLNRLKKTDNVNYYTITANLNKDLQNKNLRPWIPVNNFNEVLVYWYIENLKLNKSFLST